MLCCHWILVIGVILQKDIKEYKGRLNHRWGIWGRVRLHGGHDQEAYTRHVHKLCKGYDIQRGLRELGAKHLYSVWKSQGKKWQECIDIYIPNCSFKEQNENPNSPLMSVSACWGQEVNQPDNLHKTQVSTLEKEQLHLRADFSSRLQNVLTKLNKTFEKSEINSTMFLKLYGFERAASHIRIPTAIILASGYWDRRLHTTVQSHTSWRERCQTLLISSQIQWGFITLITTFPLPLPPTWCSKSMQILRCNMEGRAKLLLCTLLSDQVKKGEGAAREGCLPYF